MGPLFPERAVRAAFFAAPLCLPGWVFAAQGAVATSEPNATLAGLSALKDGGNAVDAAIAASFALAVTLPAAGNLGGGGFLLYRDAEGDAWFLAHREVAPTNAARGMYLDEKGIPIPLASRMGWKAAGVPGTVIGLAEAHRRWGSLKWKDLLAPAIELAEQGFSISEREHRGIARAAN